MKATMFVLTRLTLDGHPFFADWARLERFAATGRWDLQAHGHHAHDLIEISPDGTEGSFLVNRMWLSAEARLETEEEYLARVEEDYVRVKREIESRIAGAAVVGYAFPFSEAGQENAGTYPDASRVNERFLSDSYHFGFIQDANSYNELGPGSSHYLKRFSVPRLRRRRSAPPARPRAPSHPALRARANPDVDGFVRQLAGRPRRRFSTRTLLSPTRRPSYLADRLPAGRAAGARQHLEQAKRAE
jgi:hypothetical protein